MSDSECNTKHSDHEGLFGLALRMEDKITLHKIVHCFLMKRSQVGNLGPLFSLSFIKDTHTFLKHNL